MQFAEIPEEEEWNDEVPYASAFENDVESQNPSEDADEQQEPRKRAHSDKKKALLGDEEIVQAEPVKPCCCCNALTIGVSSLLVLILICGAVISCFIAADEIEKANAVVTPCTGKQTGQTCKMAETGITGICKLDDHKFINDGELICDDVALNEKACKKKKSDETCVVNEIPGKCMYLDTVSKVLWCNIPTFGELACLGPDGKSKESGSECEISVGKAVEKGTCEVVVYSRMKQCIIPDPDEEICASLNRADICTNSRGKKGSCQQMMDNQLKCVENAPLDVNMRVVTAVSVAGGLILLGFIIFGLCCYCRQKKN